MTSWVFSVGWPESATPAVALLLRKKAPTVHNMIRVQPTVSVEMAGARPRGWRSGYLRHSSNAITATIRDPMKEGIATRANNPAIPLIPDLCITVEKTDNTIAPVKIINDIRPRLILWRRRCCRWRGG